MDAKGGTVNCSTLTIYAMSKSMTSGMPYMNWNLICSWDVTVDANLNVTLTFQT